MRVTAPEALRAGIALAVIALSAVSLRPGLAAEATPFSSLAQLATALSENDADAALEFFDPSMEGYDRIERNIEALTSQADILCSIDVVSESDAEGLHKADLDWFLQLTSQADSGHLERRRERVQVSMRLVKGRWVIAALTPIGIFDPITIR